MKLYQVVQRIGGTDHVYNEFPLRKDAVKHMSRVSNPQDFTIKVIDRPGK